MEELNQFVDKHYKAILYTIITICTGFIAWVIIAVITTIAARETYVSFSLAPSTAKITIDGQTYSIGTYKFEPGTYTGNISAEGYESKTVEFKVPRGQTTSITNYLLNSATGLSSFESSEADLRTLRTMTSDFSEISDFISAYDKKYSIMSDLPLSASFDNRAESGFPGQDLVTVAIENGNNHADCKTTLCLLVTGKKIKQERVKEVINERGYNFNDYQIIYNYQ